MKDTGGCERCGLEVATGLGVELQTGRVVETADGDFHVCLSCGDIMIVDGGRWRQATLHEIINVEPKARSALSLIRKSVMRGTFHPHVGAGGMVN